MKKILLSATACLSLFSVIKAQNIKPCDTYGVRETYLKTVPGYAAKLNAAESAANTEYQAFLKNLATSKTTSVDPIYTVPVVFHILHTGDVQGTGSNINDQVCIDALAQVNKDYARLGNDTTDIDPLFEPLYVNSNMVFKLAQKDPLGNCTNGIVHHYDLNSDWKQSDIFNYKYSTMAPGNWNPSKYLNIYIVKNIIDNGSSIGTIVGYTHLPGTAPIDPADAIVYRYDFLSGLDARSLSHEIGHWFGLSHTFGSTNNPGSECGNDDIGDTPRTTGFFSTCPKPATFLNSPTVTNPVDSSDVVNVTLSSVSTTPKSKRLSSTSTLNSLNSYLIKPITSLTGTITTYDSTKVNVTAAGVAGGYSDFSEFYGNDFFVGSTTSLSVKSVASYTSNNYVGVYMDYNRNGSFADAGEAVFTPSVVVDNYSISPISNAFGTRVFGSSLKINKTYKVITGTGTATVSTTYTTTPDSFVVVPQKIILPSGVNGIVRMRVISSDSPITGPTMTPLSGEIEDYNLNIGLASCDDIRPNFENIMDYSACPKMFTQGQSAKMRQSATSIIGNRSLLIDKSNLVFTGLLDANFNTTTVTPCGPVADFVSNKAMICAGQSVTYNSTSFNGTPTSYSWVFEGGSPSTSTLATESVIYSTPGNYSVSLTVSNSDGSSSKTANSFLKTNWNAGKITLPYSEGFESGQWWPIGWTNINPDFGTLTWGISDFGSGTSSKSLILPNANFTNNFPSVAGTIDIMETPSFDLTNTTDISVSFDYSFARRSEVTTDEFELQYSLDCGGSWIGVITSPNALTMSASGGVVNGAPYLPWSSQVPNPKWKTVTINPAALYMVENKRDVKFRFWFKNDTEGGQSQNLYIDNVNISGTVGIHEFENSLGLSIYPNPTNSSATIEFTSPKDAKVNILVYDVTGRVIEENILNASAGVNSKYAVNSSNRLKSGIYFVTIIIDNNKITKKLIIE